MTLNRIIAIAFLIVPLCSFSQKKESKGSAAELQASMERDARLAEKYLQCFFTGKFNAHKRRMLFPFNEAAEVKLISFRALNDTQPTDHRDSLPVLVTISKGDFSVNQSKVIEHKTLDASGIDGLTNILFNYSYTPIRLKELYPTDSHGSCYEPRNAILFLDKSGKIEYYLEICFSCLRHRWSTSKVKNVIYCDGKYEMLRKFFANNGVVYGTKPLHAIE